MTGSFEVNENSDVYYTGSYWNDFEAVRRRINTRISGEPTTKWHEHFARSTGRSFRRALILNCGNGWVERELVEHGLVAEAVGTDYAQDLLDEAAATADALGLPLTYHQANVNTGPFPPGPFDLVVNHAAAHHVAAIDRVFREVCRVLPDDGWFVSFDYVGPHRNQYRLDAWEAAWVLNEELPASLRQDLAYPPIPVMLVVDPTEAVHSELILSTFERYFLPHQCTPLGGAIAYPMLTHNARMFAADEGERAPWIARILEADDHFLDEHPGSALFAYFAGTPRKSVLQETHLLDRWQADEVERERRAREERGGEYYDRGPLAAALVALEEQRARNAGVHARVAALESELQAMRSRLVYSRARRVADSAWFRRIRGTRVAGALQRRLGR